MEQHETTPKLERGVKCSASDHYSESQLTQESATIECKSTSQSPKEKSQGSNVDNNSYTSDAIVMMEKEQEELIALNDNPTPFISRQSTQRTNASVNLYTSDNTNNEEPLTIKTAEEAEAAATNTVLTLAEDEEELICNIMEEAINECESSVSDDFDELESFDSVNDVDDQQNVSSNINNAEHEMTRIKQVVRQAACTASIRLNLSEECIISLSSSSSSEPLTLHKEHETYEKLERQDTLRYKQHEQATVMHIHEHFRLRQLLYSQRRKAVYYTCFALAAPYAMSTLKTSNEEEKKNAHVYFAAGTDSGVVALYNNMFVEVGRCVLNNSWLSSLTQHWEQFMRTSLLSFNSKRSNKKVPVHKSTAVQCISLPLDEKVLIAAYTSKLCILWSLQTHAPLKVIHDAFDSKLCAITHLHPYSNRMLCCDERGTLHLLLYNIILGKVLTKNNFLVAAGADCVYDVVPMWQICKEKHHDKLVDINEEDDNNNNENYNQLESNNHCLSNASDDNSKFYYGQDHHYYNKSSNNTRSNEECHVVENKHYVATIHNQYLNLYVLNSGLNASMHKISEYTYTGNWKQIMQHHNKFNDHITHENTEESAQVQVQFVLHPRRCHAHESLCRSTSMVNDITMNSTSDLEYSCLSVMLCAAWGHEIVMFDITPITTNKECKADNSNNNNSSNSSSKNNEKDQLTPLISTSLVQLLIEPDYVLHAMHVITGSCLLVVMRQHINNTLQHERSIIGNKENKKRKPNVATGAILFLIDVAAGLIVEQRQYENYYWTEDANLLSTRTNKIKNNITTTINNNNNTNNTEKEEKLHVANTLSKIAVIANRASVMICSPSHIWTCTITSWTDRIEWFIIRNRFEDALELLQEVVEDVALAAVHVPLRHSELKDQCSLFLKEIAMAYVEEVAQTPHTTFIYSEPQMKTLYRVMKRILSVCVTLDLMDVYYNYIIPCLVEHHLTCEAYMVLEEFILSNIITTVPKEQLIILICWINEKCNFSQGDATHANSDNKSDQTTVELEDAHHIHRGGVNDNNNKNNIMIKSNKEDQYRMRVAREERIERVMLHLSNDLATLIDVSVQFYLTWLQIIIMAMREHKVVQALRVALTHDEALQQNNNNNNNTRNKAERHSNGNGSEQTAQTIKERVLLSHKFLSCVLLDKSFVEESYWRERSEQEEQQQQQEKLSSLQESLQREEEWRKSIIIAANLRVRAKREIWSYLLSNKESYLYKIYEHEQITGNAKIKNPLLRLFALDATATVEVLLESLRDSGDYSPWSTLSSSRAHQVQIEGVATLLKLVTNGKLVVEDLLLIIFNMSNSTNHDDEEEEKSNIWRSLSKIKPERLAEKYIILPYDVFHTIVQTIVELLLLFSSETKETTESKEERNKFTGEVYIKSWYTFTEFVLRDYAFVFDNLTHVRERKRLQCELNLFIHWCIAKQTMSYNFAEKLFISKCMGRCLTELYCSLRQYDKVIDCVLDTRMNMVDNYLQHDVFYILSEEFRRIKSEHVSRNKISNISTIEETSILALEASMLLWEAILNNLERLNLLDANELALFVLEHIAAWEYTESKKYNFKPLINHKMFTYLRHLYYHVNKIHWIETCNKNLIVSRVNDKIVNDLTIDNDSNKNSINNNNNVNIDSNLLEQYVNNKNVQNYFIALLSHFIPTQLYAYLQYLSTNQIPYDELLALYNAQTQHVNDASILLLAQQCQYEDAFALLQRELFALLKALHEQVEVECCENNKHITVNDCSNISLVQIKQQYYSHLHLVEHCIHVGADLCKLVKENKENELISNNFKSNVNREIEKSENERNWCNAQYDKNSYWVKLLKLFIMPHHLLSIRLHAIQRSKVEVVPTSDSSKNNSNTGVDLDVYFTPSVMESSKHNDNVNTKVTENYNQAKQETLFLTEGSHNITEDCISSNAINNHVDNTNREEQKRSDHESAMEMQVLHILLKCYTHFVEETVKCLRCSTNLPSMLHFLLDASANELFVAIEPIIVETLRVLHESELIHLLCYECTHKDEVEHHKRLLFAQMNSGVVPLSDCCFWCHAPLVAVPDEYMSSEEAIRQYLLTYCNPNIRHTRLYQQVHTTSKHRYIYEKIGIDRDATTTTTNSNNNNSNSSGVHNSLCVFHCGHVYHEMCQLRISAVCGENRCLMCWMEQSEERSSQEEEQQEQQEQQSQKQMRESYLTFQHHCLQGNIRSVMAKSAKTTLAEETRTESTPWQVEDGLPQPFTARGKVTSENEIMQLAERRLRQTNKLINEKDDYYDILKGYLETDSNAITTFPFQLETSASTSKHRESPHTTPTMLSKRK